jgi:hypothetical protein
MNMGALLRLAEQRPHVHIASDTNKIGATYLRARS